MPGDATRAYASMGNYLFTASCLVRALRAAHKHGETDFGASVLPRMLGSKRLFAYDFSRNRVAGIKSYEEHAYWRDVGTIDAYYEAHRDVLGAEPRLELFNPSWPIYSSNYQGPVARVIGGSIENALLGSATLVHNARIRNSIIRREAVIEDDADIEDCIIMDYVRVRSGARLRRTIVDRHNLIEKGLVSGFDPMADRKRYAVSPGGVVVIPRGRTPYFAREHRSVGQGYSE
jgi:glucose-1-phosphate adenylyltransferase